MKRTDFIFLIFIGLLVTTIISSCERDENIEEEQVVEDVEDDGESDVDTSNTTTTSSDLTDVFVYYENTELIFVIKDGVSSVKTTKMTWNVSDFNQSTNIATINCTLGDEGTTVPVGSTFYLRKSSTNILEYSSDGLTWANLTGSIGTSNFSFLFGTKAAKPTSLLGSVTNQVKSAMVSYPDGSSTGYRASSEYNSSRYDNYLFTEYTKEYYCEKTGFTKSISFTSDQSDYPPWTYKREVDLISYKIYLPDGSIFEGGETKPDAPSNLSGTYKKNISSWNSSTGMYEKRSYVSLSWTDNSKNETHFNIYMKAVDNNYYPIDEMIMYEGGPSFTPTTFPSNSFSGSIKAGYYVNWSPGTYYFKLTAASLDQESDFSNEAIVTVY